MAEYFIETPGKIYFIIILFINTITSFIIVILANFVAKSINMLFYNFNFQIYLYMHVTVYLNKTIRRLLSYRKDKKI